MVTAKNLIIILLLGLLLRTVNLNQSFWLDEASQAQQSTRSLYYVWKGRSADFHPPLFYVLSHYWLQAGQSEVWARIPSLTFSLAEVVVLFLLARKLFPDSRITVYNKKFDLSLVAALLLAINPFHVYYAQEFRSYSLLSLLSTISMYLFVSQKYTSMALVNALAIYTHYSGFYLILTQLLITLFSKRKEIPKMLLALILTFLVYIPWIPQLATQLASGINIDTYLPGWRHVLSLSPLRALPVTLFKLVAGRINFLSRYLYGAYIAFVFGVTFTALALVRKHKNLLFGWAFIPIFSLLAVSVALPQIQPFRVIFVLPALVLIFAQAALRFPKLFLTLLIYISLVGNIAYFTRPRLQREQWRQASQFLVTQNAHVVVKFPDRFAPLAWYVPDLEVTAAVPQLPPDPARSATALSFLVNDNRDVLLLQYLSDLTDRYHQVDQILADLGYLVVQTYDYPGVGFIDLYRRQNPEAR